MQYVSDLTSLLNRALQTECGIVVKFDSPYAARHTRRKLYAEREKLRKAGHKEYDGVSLMIRAERELMIIKRDAIPIKQTAFVESHLLTPDELPPRILSRGKSRPGVGISSLFFIIQSVMFFA